MGGIRSKLGNVADKAKELGESVAEVAADPWSFFSGKTVKESVIGCLLSKPVS